MSEGYSENAVAPEPAEVALFNLDTIEKEGPKRPPFTFEIQGRVLTLRDPVDLGWVDIDRMDRESEVIPLAIVGEDNSEWFTSLNLPIWKMAQLGKAYQKHYKVDDASGKAGSSGSSGSSSRS